MTDDSEGAKKGYTILKRDRSYTTRQRPLLGRLNCAIGVLKTEVTK